MTEIVNYTDCWYQVKYTYEIQEESVYVLNFEAYKIKSMTEFNGNDIPEELEEIKAVEGYLKWDGCMEVKFQEGGYEHFCGLHIANQLGELFKEIYKKGSDLGMDL